jgi:hypothetical protein
MATQVITYDPFKRGDTAAFTFEFTEPYEGFDWSTVTIDSSMTAVEAPSDNSGAAAIRLNQSLTTDASNTASYTLQLSVSESKSLVPDSTYNVEAQLKESSGTFVTTPITGQVTIVQDYVI